MATPLLLPSGRPLEDAAPPPALQVGLPLERRGHAPGRLMGPLTVFLALVTAGVAGGMTASLMAGEASPVVTAPPPVQSFAYLPGPESVALPALIANVSRSAVAIDVTARTPTGVRGQAFASENFGTGFVLTADGLIATAAHVVEDAVMISVTMPDGSIARGTLVGLDVESDLAVIKVQRQGLTPVTLGASASLRAGDLVVGLGNSLALGGGLSATLGIISATGRTITTGDGTTYTGLIQVDAPVNSGASGGPLVNGAGYVVGVNTASVTANAGSSIGFAIPIDIAAPILLKIAGIK